MRKREQELSKAGWQTKSLLTSGREGRRLGEPSKMCVCVCVLIQPIDSVSLENLN